MTNADDTIPEIREYDEKGNLTHCRHCTVYEWWMGRDEKGNATHYRTSDGFETWWQYDRLGKLISRQHFSGVNTQIKSEPVEAEQ